MNSSYAPIVLFVYNRLTHTQQTVNALKTNKLAKKSELYVYSDGPKDKNLKKSVDEVRRYIKTITGFKKITIIEGEKNIGLASSIIQGVTEIISKNDKVIVIEDDLFVSPLFLNFLNDGLAAFENRDDIFSITGFNFPEKYLKIPEEYTEDLYLNYRCMSWGWATWKDRWLKVDWTIKNYQEFSNNKKEIKLFNRGGDDLFPMLTNQLNGEIDSWAIRFCYAHYKNNSFCVYPVKSFVDNRGFDGSGIHCGNDEDNKFENITLNNSTVNINPNILINKEIIKLFYIAHKYSLSQKIKIFLIKYLPKGLIQFLKRGLQ